MTTRRATGPAGRCGRRAFVALLVATLASEAEAAAAQRRGGCTVRGRLVRGGPSRARRYPAANVRVTLAPVSIKARPMLTYSDTDGMFLFRDVGAGTWRIEVWLSGNQPTTTREITVTRSDTYVDVPPITV
jgi:hypothetical protein